MTEEEKKNEETSQDSNGTHPKEEKDPLETCKQETAEYKDKYLRTLAESENLRKRLQKEKQEMTLFAVQKVVVEFIEPIDHMENALKYTEQMSEEMKHWSLGFQMILTQFKDVLASNGVTAFVSQGTHFDPHLHEAVETEERTDIPAGVVIEEFVRGYKMGDKTIRPARVKVSKAPQNKEDEVKL